MNSPFINTILYTTITLHPSQLNNDIYPNLKKNLITKLEKKCYKNYGYISKIYEILEHDDGMILAEDPLAAPIYKVKFSCLLCHPLKNMQIICKAKQFTKLFIRLVREPMEILVTDDRISSNFEYSSITNQYRKKHGDYLSVGDFVKITVVGKIFTDKDKRIMVLGHLDDLATKEEIETYYADTYSTITPPSIDRVPTTPGETHKHEISENSQATTFVDIDKLLDANTANEIK